MKPLTSLLVKPSGPDCNLDCTYCFYLEKSSLFPKHKIHRMPPNIQEEMIKQFLQQAPTAQVSIGWQGGEPTLMGLDFFKRAVQLEKKYGQGKTVGNGFQTNGLLLNQEWADFLAEYNFLVGISLDGPQHIHDHYRLDTAGQGTWQRVHNNAEMLLKKGVATNALTCVTSYSVNYPEEIYNYHKKLGLNWMQFIPIVETDKNDPTKAADFSVSAEQFGEFLCRVFDLWQADFSYDGTPSTSVRHFDSIFHTYVGLTAPECTMQKECGVYLVVEHNGNVYGCDFFVDKAGFLGNIKSEKMSRMLNSKKQKMFGKMKNMLTPKCKKCPWLKHCWGGCPKDRIKDPRDNNQCHFCKSYEIFFAHADLRFRQMAEQWKEQNGHTTPNH